MKLFTTTALAAVLTAGTAFSAGMTTESAVEGSVEAEVTTETAEASTDTKLKTDGSTDTEMAEGDTELKLEGETETEMAEGEAEMKTEGETVMAEGEDATKETMAEIEAVKTASMEGAEELEKGNLIRTRDITGGAIYTLKDGNAEGWDMEWAHADVRDRLDEIGEIEDVVLTKDGSFKGIVAEVGGFLDIGDKHVMIPVTDVKLIAVDDKTYAYVTRMSEEQLESLPDVDEGFWD